MSIIESLKRLVDPVQAHAEDLERKRQREQPVREADGDPPAEEVVAAVRAKCRVCGFEGTDPRFCPECLAETMVFGDSRSSR